MSIFSQKSVLALDPAIVRGSNSHFMQFSIDFKNYILERESRSFKNEIAQAQTFSDNKIIELSNEAPKIKPNIVLLILESTGYHWTPLSEGEDVADMPFFKKLADESLEIINTRTTMPHSAKSFVSIFSGQYPTMTSFLTLTQKDYEIATLASYLSDYGYKSAFFQPARASFERRPPLIKNFGFDHFLTAEEVDPRSPVLGAFNRDDFILLDPIVNWAETQEGPYFLTMFTSVTHHPYVLPGEKNMTNDQFLGLSAKVKKENYFKALNYSDGFIKSLVNEIKALGEDTLFVIVGDHGEGFGEHGLFAHSQNVYEESLRVPLIFHWPGKIEPERKEGFYSVMDISPTILGYLGVESFNSEIYGIDINSQVLERDLFFSAWQDNTSLGFVDSSGKKIIHDPINNIWEMYDIKTDPREQKNLFNEENFSEEDISEIIEKLVSWKEKTLSGIRKVEGREYFEVYNWICSSDAYGSCKMKNKKLYSDL